MTDDEFYAAVKLMRVWQRKFAADRADEEAKREAVYHTGRVDGEIAERERPKMGSLFKGE